ncbi:uncharacterized protein BO88DRAFT_444409 [Aspergillus vadensis CBS 113365]|uniref:Uncharacterized protein n=1 Tax=Aspergillus vadensis (strain CBS 113365 / IMI 142717 / IBT 24658) TaxID=1448311 RepID=A0A319B5N9_ASPVC|nr:hypothetical protein BO88DRAFT_444409 [Aspergillus vadensis CBS 113365]PYH68126.1 hypothetical protein BO88DRAFT_444409 [Aspergillus vadensis CBS 113365]
MDRDKVATNGSIFGNSLQEGFSDGCGAVLDRAVPPRTLDEMLIGWGNRQRLYRERTNGRWGLMGVGSERGIAVLSRVELYGGGETYLLATL